MSEFRFNVGSIVLCNLGEQGWMLGRIIALNYREEHWPEGQVAPYQVALEDDYSLIYVPEDNDHFCRETTDEDVKILKRKDALAEFRPERNMLDEGTSIPSKMKSNLCCSEDSVTPKYQRYRKGRCFCCDDCARDWLYAELYSEHYRCAERNNLKVTRHEVDLGVFQVGDLLHQKADPLLLNKKGFMQAPTLVVLPPGILFSDDGSLAGEIHYDPQRGEQYPVHFVAVSTSDWNDDSVGLIRLEIRFKIEGNKPPSNFDVSAFQKKEFDAREAATELLIRLNRTWNQWGSEEIGNRVTCTTMLADLNRLRELLEAHPRLDRGKWWGHLGGYHMNVHKLLENTLFECELYLGYALTFGDNEVQFYAEQNLKGCYQKRLLEAARFMWYDGIELMLRNEWTAAIDLFRLAYAKKEGWGWAVNYGDIWLSEAVSLMIHGAEKHIDKPTLSDVGWRDTAHDLIQRALARANDSGVFGSEGHPWIHEVYSAHEAYKELISNGRDASEWLEDLKSRTIFWCSQVLAGVFPFPPKSRTRLAQESVLIRNLPEHNA